MKSDWRPKPKKGHEESTEQQLYYEADFQEGAEAMAKALVERIEELRSWPSIQARDCFVSEEKWQELRKEVGLR